MALGLIDDTPDVAVFTRRGDEIRIISVRRAIRKERLRYAKAGPFA